MSKKLADQDWISDDDIAYLVKDLNIQDPDAIIVSDGSGTTREFACGWASIIVAGGNRKILQGAMNFGTSYLAEVLPYVQALSWYIEGPGRAVLLDKLKESSTARVQVHAVTDNETVAKQGQGKMGRRIGSYYWAMLDDIESNGFDVNWHWIPRATNSLNRVCDYLSGVARKSLAAVEASAPPDWVMQHPLYASPN